MNFPFCRKSKPRYTHSIRIYPDGSFTIIGVNGDQTYHGFTMGNHYFLNMGGSGHDYEWADGEWAKIEDASGD